MIAGISGTGKSAIALELAGRCDVETRIWIDATELSRPEQLKDRVMGRRGVRHNIASVLKKRKCVLVLDNLKVVWSMQDLASLAGGNSIVIATSQTAGERDDVVVIGNVARDVGQKILALDGGEPCPDAVFETIWKATHGHPLLLRVLASLAKASERSWNAVLECCSTVVSHGEDENHQKICQRVLTHLLPALNRELSFFLWCDSPSVDSRLFYACVSPLAKQNLEKRHLLVAATSDVVQIHDIVYASARSQLHVMPSDAADFRAKLEQSLAADKDDRLYTDRVGRKHYDLLKRQLREHHSWEIQYALSRSRVVLSCVESFGDVVSQASALSTNHRPADIAVKSIIEAIEATYSLTAEYQDKTAAQTRLQSLMQAFDTLDRLPLSSDGRLEVRHHRAKMLDRLDQKEEAEAQFRALLKDAPNLHQAKLQLVRLLKKANRDEAVRLTKELIDTPDPIPPSLQIAAWVEAIKLDPTLLNPASARF